ncbi:MAG: aminoacetone oxidase family FAD-binding enzyme [Bacilli bacterium]|nr:aminoacetone oxidase family FAD-binding enzyme [Bacilli bacterium]
MKIGIIGGGASGLLAAIVSKSKNNEVIIFERNNFCGKKILATGNGRCNYWNQDQNLLHYHSTNNELIRNIVNDNVDKKVLEFFDRLGIVPKIKNGYYYPFSNQASTIKNALITEVERLGIKVLNNFLVKNITINDNGFTVSSQDENITVDKLIIATGSYASPKTGSDGMGYNFLEKFDHTIIKPLPSLVQLKTKGNFLKMWSGVRAEAKVSLYEDDRFVREEIGELQLTNYGISGICVFNLSNYVARGLDNNKREEIVINFMPFINDDKLTWFINQTNLTNKNIKELLLSVLNEKIVEVILKESRLNSNKLFNEVNVNEQNILINYCTNFKLEVIGTNSFDEAQVCGGGVSLEEIDLSTMESKIIKNLYVTGELLDITGDCGGYNLGIAWRTGIIAGISIRGNND